MQENFRGSYLYAELHADHPGDAWIRVHLLKGDLIVLPAGVYHRFTLDESGAVKAMRLFKVCVEFISTIHCLQVQVGRAKMEGV